MRRIGESVTMSSVCHHDVPVCHLSLFVSTLVCFRLRLQKKQLYVGFFNLSHKNKVIRCRTMTSKYRYVRCAR